MMSISKLRLLVVGLLTGMVMFTQGAEKSGLPRVLIIGDSISIGYTKPLKTILEGKAQVIHHRGNAQHTVNGLEKLDSWLGKKPWDVIHFNHGLHDLKYVDDQGKNTTSKEKGHIQVPVDEYEKNMEAIVVRLKKTGAKLIFATTTPYPDKPAGPLREAKQPALYNAAALKVMKKHDIPINDLYTIVKPQLKKLQKPKNVHFKKEGSEFLAEAVAEHVMKALALEASEVVK